MNTVETPSTYITDSVNMARCLVSYGNRNSIFMNITKTQKLLYIAYGIYLADKGQRLFDEHPQCWPFGPVFPTTRNRLLKERLESITDISDNAEINGLIEKVFDKFGAQTAQWLSEWSHQAGSPWDKTRLRVGFKWGMQIEDQDIELYFKQMSVA